MGEFIAATRASFRPCMALLSARCCSSGGSTWRLQSVCKLLANPTSTSLNIPLGNENEALDSSKHHGNCKIKLLHWTVTLTSLHLQRNEGQYHAFEDCDCPHRLGCCVSLNVVRIKPIDVCFLIFAHWSPCQQCHDSVAGPDVGRSVAGAEFLFYHSNFVVYHLKLKARKNCRHRLVDLSSW